MRNSTIKPKPCSYCGGKHSSLSCFKKPRAELRAKAKLKRSPLRKQGKQYLKWAQTRNKWLQANGTDHNCHYCGKRLDISTLTLDHKLSRSRRPDLRHAESNLVPSCLQCNEDKGSLSPEEYEQKKTAE